MTTPLIRLSTALAVTLSGTLSGILAGRWRDDRGEGVISTAVAVLIVALIGAAAYVAFRGIFDGAATKTSGVVDGIGA